MTHSFIAYIDEAGDDGLSGKYRAPGKGGGSSHWLTIGAAVWRQSRDLDAVQWARDIIAQMPERKRGKPLHFANLDHSQRVMAIGGICQKPIRTVSVFAHKPIIPDGIYTKKNQLYQYMCRYLIERISWLCRDMRPQVPEGDGKVKIVFSRRGGMAYDAFRSYLQLLHKMNDPEIKIHWPVIDISGIEAHDHGARYGLQLADLAVSGLTAGLEPDYYGNCELRFARMLKPSVYRRKGNYLSYGAKIHPAPERLPLTPNQQEFVELFRK